MGNEVEIGRILREKRLEFGWDVETVAELYGQAVRGKSLSGGAVFNMEEGTIPQGEKRRLVLARIFSIPPAALGLKVLSEDKGKIPTFPLKRSRLVDVSEYQTTLRSYRTQAGQGYQRSPEAALKDLGQRIAALQEKAYYVRSPQRDQMKRLLWGYHVRRSYVAKELSYHTGALDHLNKALILAQEEEFVDLETASRYVRGQFFFEKRDFSRASRELNVAQSQIGSAPELIRGSILRMSGLTDAHLAKTASQLSQAIKRIDAYGRSVTPQLDQKRSSQGESLASDTEHGTAQGDASTIDIERDILLLRFSEIWYLLSRARALVAPRETSLHLADEAYSISDGLLKKCDSAQKRFHAYHTLDDYIILAQYYLDKGYYAIATTQTENALTQMKEMDSFTHLPAVVGLYEQLTESSYGKEVAVAELGLHLLFVQYPWFFT